MTELITPAELADKIKDTSAERVVRLCRQHNWPHVRMGRAIRFTPEQVEQIVAMQTVTPKAKPSTSGQTARSKKRAA